LPTIKSIGSFAKDIKRKIKPVDNIRGYIVEKLKEYWGGANCGAFRIGRKYQNQH